MVQIDQALFLALNATPHATPFVVGVARFLALGLIWILAAAMAGTWLRASLSVRAILLAGVLTALLALAVNQLIGLAWYRPRPFEIHLGHAHMGHVADSSFPSDHLTVIWSVAFTLCIHARTRLAGIVLATLALPVAWARIFLGVHYPSDMVGAALVSAACACLVAQFDRSIVRPVATFVSSRQRAVLAPFIRRGWVRE